jgi:hypothetical protein
MTAPLRLHHEPDRHVEIAAASGAPLWRYVYRPDTPARESPRPYAHPVYSFAGDVLTNFRPNDHPWHHALSLTLTSVGGVNFWGGPSYRAEDGYRWREDHGAQRHCAWAALDPQRLEEDLEWVAPPGTAGGEIPPGTLLRERRVLRTRVAGAEWTLQWTSGLVNVSGRELTLGNPHALGRLAGSHYTGLQFRGARDLLDDHGDPEIGLAAEGGLAGEAGVHGAPARWMEWRCQHDGSLRRTRIRFENPGGPLPWFVRAKNPLAAFAFHREHAQRLAPGATLRLDHALTFANA